MPVLLHSYSSRSHSDNCIHIGLINNMPDEALKATERQYISLLNEASEGMQIRLSFYTLPGVPRSDANNRHTATFYSNIDDLWAGQLDGLIVTGREPLAADLREEPYWDSFTKTLSWARENAHATIWSCLAAHAAVLHMDGIRRAKRNDKLFGVFACERLIAHELIWETPATAALPHSRWNSLSGDQLSEAGYSVLTRTTGAEVDTFIKQEKKLFVFFQGHPEYEADTLLREYRRDIARYFKGETARYPLLPQGYFNRQTEAIMEAFQLQSMTGQKDELLAEISAALGAVTIENTWRSSATRLYENWLRHIRVQKDIAARSKKRKRIVQAAAVPCSSPAFTAPAEA